MYPGSDRGGDGQEPVPVLAARPRDRPERSVPEAKEGVDPMTRSWQISRRAVLRGLSTPIAPPWLEAMAPATALAGGAPRPLPKRMAFLYVPNGAHMEAWTPAKEGADFELPHILEPLERFKDDLLVLSGLSQDNAAAHGDGGGD